MRGLVSVWVPQGTSLRERQLRKGGGLTTAIEFERGIFASKAGPAAITSVPTSPNTIEYEDALGHLKKDASAEVVGSRRRAWLGAQRAFAWQPEDFATRFEDPRAVSLSLLESWIELQANPANGPWRDRADQDARRLDALGGEILARDDQRYPQSLSALMDPPVAMLFRGTADVLDTPSVAIIGARAATRAALAQSRRLGFELASRGFTIVSGLARGIDAEAHWGALEAGGPTVAVIASGLDQIYPPEHRNLAERIAEQGAVISEMPLGTPPRRELFPLRNRIISGLCRGVVVVEARKRSGSLITVRHALAQGREVFVVPGSVDGPFAAGSNGLLREGARPLLSASDLIEDLGGEPETIRDRPEQVVPVRSDPVRSQRFKKPSGLEGELLKILEAGPATRDMLLLGTAADPGRMASALLDLELAGRVVEERDGRFHRIWSPPDNEPPKGR